MSAALELIAKKLAQASRPEDVFGEISEADQGLLSGLRKSYRELVKVVHPDLYETTDEKILAHVALGHLIEWYGEAQVRIQFGIYGLKDKRQP